MKRQCQEGIEKRGIMGYRRRLKHRHDKELRNTRKRKVEMKYLKKGEDKTKRYDKK